MPVDEQDHQRWSDAALDAEPVLSHRSRRRLVWVAAAFLVLVLLAVLPPLVNVNRYQRRVAQSITASIGRPVHFDSIAVHLLPVPGFTIQNFVVSEDPAFGFEPAMRANTVEATLRLRSLWRRRVEISRIRLEEPSVNLVRRFDGQWNLQGVVTQAGTLQSAPTAQPEAGTAPRFPYVEARGARINVKMGDEKLPYSLVDSDFALWLPDPTSWRLRLAGRPLRTDTDVSDVGLLNVEGTLGRGHGSSANAPLELTASWKPTPLGEAAKLFIGNDAGWRGEASAEVTIHGTPAAMAVAADLHLHHLRRASFVPAETMELDAHCDAAAMGVLHQLKGVRCTLPTEEGHSLWQTVGLSRFGSAATPANPPVSKLLPGTLLVTADIPDAGRWSSTTVDASVENASPEWFLRWLRLFSQRIPAGLTPAGSVRFTASQHAAPGSPTVWSGNAVCVCTLPPYTPAGAKKPLGSRWIIAVAAGAAALMPGTELPREAVVSAGIPSDPEEQPNDLAPPASLPEARVVGSFGLNGYDLTYATPSLVRYAASLLPTLGDDLPAVPDGAMTAERNWGSPQRWSQPPAPQRPIRRHRSRHR